MKVIINGKFLTQNISGVQRYAMEIAKRLRQQNADILVVSPANIIHTELAEMLGARVVGKGSGHRWEQFSLPAFLKKEFGHQKYLLLNFTNTAPLLCRNNIVTLHDITFIRFADSYSFLFSTYYKFIIPRIVKNAKMVFTVSETAKRELADYFKLSANRIGVTYNAIDQSVFNEKETSEEDEGSSLLQKHGVSRFMLAVSMFNPIKNLMRLMEAFTQERPAGVKLVVVGEHYKSFRKDPAMDAFRIDPDIVFLGRIDNARMINFLYRKADLFAFPSLYESFGIPPLEAMASGCPVLVSRAGALPEVCGDAAEYVDPYNTADIASGIRRVLQDETLRSRLVRAGRERVQHFRWEAAVAAISSQLEQLGVQRQTKKAD